MLPRTGDNHDNSIFGYRCASSVIDSAKPVTFLPFAGTGENVRGRGGNSRWLNSAGRHFGKVLESWQ